MAKSLTPSNSTAHLSKQLCPTESESALKELAHQLPLLRSMLAQALDKIITTPLALHTCSVRCSQEAAQATQEPNSLKKSKVWELDLKVALDVKHNHLDFRSSREMLPRLSTFLEKLSHLLPSTLLKLSLPSKNSSMNMVRTIMNLLEQRSRTAITIHTETTNLASQSGGMPTEFNS